MSHIIPSNSRRISILGTGAAVPANQLLSIDQDKILNLAIGSIQQATGVISRYVAKGAETAASLAAEACRQALVEADLNPEDIDCLIAASATMDQALPYNAALIHRALDWMPFPIQTMDIGASCLSFLAAWDQISYALCAGRYRNILLVSSDIASVGLDWSVLESSGIFGDGAAAIVLSPPKAQNTSEILASDFQAFSAGVDFCELRGSGSRFHPSKAPKEEHLSENLFRMNGKKVYKLAATYLPDFIDKLLSRCQITKDELDWIVPHQASMLAMHHLTGRLGFRPERVVNIFENHGNQVAASLPTALHIARKDGRIKQGDRILLLGTGAGVSFGGIVLRV